jgi:hypothetical protein
VTEIDSYYGPTAWDAYAGSLWHYDCPDTIGAGHDGQVTEDDDGVFCDGCHAYQPPSCSPGGEETVPNNQETT